MINVKVAILDDESRDLEKVKDYFMFVSNQHISYDCSCFDNGVSIYDESFDLYILDIEMPNLNGLEVAENIKEKYPNSVIVLHSKRNDLVFESFKVGVFFFVRKDNFEEDMKNAQKRFDQHFKKSNMIYNYQNKDIIRNIQYRDIMYIEKVGHRVEIHLCDGEILRDNISMRNILPKFESFIHCHQSYLVNLSHVDKIDSNDFFMKNGDRVQISKRNLIKVKKAYIDYLNKKVAV